MSRPPRCAWPPSATITRASAWDCRSRSVDRLRRPTRFAGNFTTGSGRAVHRGARTRSCDRRRGCGEPLRHRGTGPLHAAFGREERSDGRCLLRRGEHLAALASMSAEAGDWKWASACWFRCLRLHGRSGDFRAETSTLRGMLRKHEINPKAWMTDDGPGSPTSAIRVIGSFTAGTRRCARVLRLGVGGQGDRLHPRAALGGWGGTPGARVDDSNTWVGTIPGPAARADRGVAST